MRLLTLSLLSAVFVPGWGSSHRVQVAQLSPQDPAPVEELQRTSEEVRKLLEAGEVDRARAALGALAQKMASWGEGEPGELGVLFQLDSLAVQLSAVQPLVAVRGRTAAIRESTPSQDRRPLLEARALLAVALYMSGDLEGARELQEEVLFEWEELLPEDHAHIIWGQQNLAATLFALGDLEGARGLFELVLEARQRVLPEDHPELLSARANLAAVSAELGDLVGARMQQELLLASCERTLPEDHPDLTRARQNLAETLRRLGDLPGARALQEQVLETLERTLPEDHPMLLDARLNYAAIISSLGDLNRARELQEQVLAVREQTLPDDHPDLLRTRTSVALTWYDFGELDGARELQEGVLEARERTLPEDHPDLLGARENLAITLESFGALNRARGLLEEVLRIREQNLPEDHPRLLATRGNLAVVLKETGDLETARLLEEQVLAARERTLPEDHLFILKAREALADTLGRYGDREGERVLHERALEIRERTLPEDHPDLLASRLNFGAVLHHFGDFEGARAQFERALEGYERSYPEDYPARLATRANLARVLAALGELAGARSLIEQVLEVKLQRFPEGHTEVCSTRSYLALLMILEGELEAAHELAEQVMEAYGNALPPSSPQLLGAQGNLIYTKYVLEDFQGMSELLPAFGAGLLERLQAALGLAPREAQEVAASVTGKLDGLIFFSQRVGLEPLLATLIETRRHVATQRTHPGRAGDGDGLSRMRLELTRLRAQINDRTLAGPAAQETMEDWRDSIVELSLQRDRLSREVRSLLAERGAVFEVVRAEDVLESLQAGDLAVGFLRYTQWGTSEAITAVHQQAPALMAMVFARGKPVRRVELGPLTELEQRIHAWRSAIGKPVERGVSLAVGPDADELGRALRRALFDPIVTTAGGLEEGARVHLCLDDVLHLVPIDALPSDRPGVVLGDLYRLRNEVSFARLVAGGEAQPASEGSGLLVVGDIDFDAELVPEMIPEYLAAVNAAPIDRARGSAFGNWGRLWGTKGELQAVSAQYEEVLGQEVVLLERNQATKAAVFEAVRGRCFLHLATHGWFAPESVLSTLDAARREEPPLFARTERAIRGFAPLTLCGLCLAGANRGRDSVGRVPGLLTAEELAGYDLSACELAVLSACETNVGSSRAGQGILSLQTALHAAGARTAITSLWKVNDDLTKDLMTRFYENLWRKGMGKAEALWEAKKHLRAQGYPIAAWAGWVLTGDPD